LRRRKRARETEGASGGGYAPTRDLRVLDATKPLATASRICAAEAAALLNRASDAAQVPRNGHSARLHGQRSWDLWPYTTFLPWSLIIVGLRDGRGSRKAERLSKLSDPKYLIRTMPAKGDRPVGPTRLPDTEDGLATTVATPPDETHCIGELRIGCHVVIVSARRLPRCN